MRWPSMAGVLGCLASCAFPTLEPGLALTCDESRALSACPADHACREGRCRAADLASGAVSPAVVRADQRLVATFSADVTVPPTVWLVSEQGRNLVPLSAVPGFPDGGWAFESTVRADAGWPEGRVLVLADLSSGGRVSLGHLVGESRLDFSAPRMVVGQLQLLPGADNPLRDISALGPGSTLRLSAVADEPLQGLSAAAVPCDGGPPTLALSLNAAPDGLQATASGVLPSDGGTEVQGCHVLQVTLTDVAGNEATVDGGTFELDTVAPLAPDVDLPGKIVYRREPVGTAQRATARFTLRVTGGLEEDGTLLAFNESLVGSQATVQRTVPELPLSLLAEARGVRVALADRAGNVSPLRAVRDIEWLGRLGAEALDVFERRADTSSLESRAETRPGPLTDGGLLIATPAASWRRREYSAPVLENAAFACSDERGECLQFGGRRSGTFFTDETWRWDGDEWSALALLTAPTSRVRAAMAFDPVRGRYVLVGGESTSQRLDDVWEWDGVTWSRAPAFPGGAVAGHAMAYDAARLRLQLIGGSTPQGPSAMIWERDPMGVWSNVTPLNGVPRQGHSAVYDRIHRRTLVLGGTSTMQGAFAAFDGESWTGLPSPPATIGPRAQHAAFWEPATGLMHVVKGTAQATALKCATWDSRTGVWAAGLGSACSAVATNPSLWAAGGVLPSGIVIADGSPGLNTWQVVNGAVVGVAAPGERTGGTRWKHTMTELPGGVVVVGGARSGTLLDACGILNQAGWSAQPPLPSPTSRPAAARTGDAVAIIGGAPRAGGSPASVFAPATGWTTSAPLGLPFAIAGHAIATRPDGGLLLFGGETAAGTFGETWSFSGSWARVNTPGPAPGPRADTAMAPLADGSVLLVGGQTPLVPLADAWLFENAAWRPIDAGTLTPRSGHAMATDRDGIGVLFGGQSVNGMLGDTWQYRDGRWTQVDVVDVEGDGEPSDRAFHAMAVGPHHRVLMVGGGQSESSTLDDAWELRRFEAAHRVSVPFSLLGAVKGTELVRVRFSVVAGAQGGARLASWRDGAFRTEPGIAANASPATAPTPLAAVISDEAALRTMSLQRSVSAVIRGQALWPSAGHVSVGQIEVEIHYRRPGGP